MSARKTLEHYIRKDEAEPLSAVQLKKYLRRPGLKFVDYENIGKGMTLKSLLGAANGV